MVLEFMEHSFLDEDRPQEVLVLALCCHVGIIFCAIKFRSLLVMQPCFGVDSCSGSILLVAFVCTCVPPASKIREQAFVTAFFEKLPSVFLVL